MNNEKTKFLYKLYVKTVIFVRLSKSNPFADAHLVFNSKFDK